MQKQATVGVGTIADVYHTLLEHGVSTSELTSKYGIQELDIDNPDARIPISCIPNLWIAAIDITNTPSIGLKIGCDVKPERLSIVAQAFVQSENLYQGIQQYIRFFRLVNEAVEVVFEQHDESAQISFRVSPDNYNRPEMERTVASAVARARYFMGESIHPTEVHFQHSEPEYGKSYERYFSAPVLFDQTETRLLFKAKHLWSKSKSRNPYLYKVLIHHAESLLKRIQPKTSTQDAVLSFIRQNLSKDKLDVDIAAKHLNMSRHTLYRKLKKSDVSFQSMVEKVRREEAIKLLSNRDISVSEVAFLLGFSELSAFSRAFKRWTGMSPAQYREAQAS